MSLPHERVRVEVALRGRGVEPAERDRDVVQPSRREPGPEVAKTGRDDPDDGHGDVRKRQIDDEYLVAQAVGLIDKHGVPRDRYEFQMLLGVDEELRRILIQGGHRLRVYVPYGQDWYGYLMRRLAERPQNLSFFLRSLISKK